MPANRALRPILVTAVLTGAVGSVYLLRSPSRHLHSAVREPTKTFSFPSTMFSSRELKVRRVEQINHNTKRITFELPGGESEVSGVPASSAILIQHTTPASWLPTFRPYTPISPPTQQGTLDLLVKHYPHGEASTHIHALQPGDTLTARGPLPGYTYRPSVTQPRSLILIAGGAGITPIYSLTHEILTTNQKDQISLEDLERRFPGRLNVTYAVSGPAKEVEELGDVKRFRKGYVDGKLLKEAIGRCGGRLGDENGKMVVFCGPPKMEESVMGLLMGMGLAKKDVYKF
ncbi:NADH-cytochrome b5 reductase [Rhizophlyctis rosea]|uniref:cytochrome-b5 reductase n=1 Tax=Rhizophlyctis rosea TaxID=64517 RepID=A0AAD5SJ37_9FUNG|nr:NADH-cytochrome b5 reductase [Rhizophlyctis rosea]